MKVMCDYCSSYINDYDKVCKYCGANNPNFHESNIPRTIDELLKWYNTLDLPDKSITRIFINEDFREPIAFGIYKDGDKYIVYMNNKDGNRIIRYDGADESYAVNELYLKIKEILIGIKR